MKKYLVLVILLSLALVVGCSTDSQEKNSKKVKLAYVEWSTEVASTNVVKAVLEEKLGYDVEITPVSAAAMFQAVATKDVDAMVAAWLPTIHESYVNEVKEKIEDLGPNLTGTYVGLVVPSYVDINSIEDLNNNADKFKGKIIGIDPGAGIMSKTEKALEDYNLNNFELMEGSGATMTAALADAIKNKEWVVVTGWSPHWKFARWDLKYLKDPQGIYGEEEEIHTLVRKGLKDDMIDVYNFLDKFNWTKEDMEQIMVWNQEDGADPYENAKRWVSENEDKVNEWLK